MSTNVHHLVPVHDVELYLALGWRLVAWHDRDQVSMLPPGALAEAC